MCSKAAFALSHGTLFTRNCIFVYMYYGKAAVSSLPGSAAAVPCGLARRARQYRVAYRRRRHRVAWRRARHDTVWPTGGGLAWVRKVVA